MTFITQNFKRFCFIPCSSERVKHGLCSCVNRNSGQVPPPSPIAVESSNETTESSISSEILIRVFSGVSVEDKCGHQLHPLNDVIQAQKILSLKKSIDLYSNSPDFVSAIKYLCQESKIKCEFLLDGKSFGDDIEPIFESFNKSLDLLNELCPNSHSVILINKFK